MKYIVYWILYYAVSVPCPSANQVDEFGRGGKSFGIGFSCGVDHIEDRRDTLSKEFTTIDAANEFIQRVKSEQIEGWKIYQTGLEYIDTVWMESIEIHNKEK